MYTCKCCNHPTLPVPPENAIAFICPDCFWENDVFTADENEPSDENRGLTLTEGRENYNRYGICDPRLKEPNGRGSDESTVPQEPISALKIGGSSTQKSFLNPKQQNQNDLFRIQKAEDQYIPHRLGDAVKG